MSELIGKMIGGFRILAEMNSGGQGQVFRAVCEKPPFDGIAPGTVVALKVMAVHDEDISTLTKKCKQLTSIFGQFVHPNVVRYYGCFVVTDTFDVIRAIEVQEWLRGETLKQRLARNPHGLDADEALHVTDASLSGLEYVAANGIVHRDLKPSNIFLCLDANGAIKGVKLIDFEWIGKAALSVTVVDTFDYDYMAPDFTNSTFRGDERSDVFSMGVVMHEAITGRKPYQRSASESKQGAGALFLSRWARLHEAETNPIQISPCANLLLTHSREVLERALAPLPENRYASFAEFHTALKTIHPGDLKSGGNTYRLLQRIRCDGFCDVFKARILETDRLVFVKRFSDGYHGDRLSGGRLLNESLILQKLLELEDVSYFTKYLDYFNMPADDSEEAELPGRSLDATLVVEYLPGMPGSSLRDAIRRAGGSPLPLRETLLAFARFAHGLSILHSHGIIHRDIKPTNLYYPEGQPERVAIMDFIIARDIHQDSSGETGMVPGTLDYMPPEVVTSSCRGDAGSDIYALGLSLYEALTGKAAYPRLLPGRAAFAAFAAFYERVKSKTQPTFDSPVVTSRPKLLQLLKDMTNIDPEKRIRDAAEVERRLSELAATVNEQDLSGVHHLDDTSLCTTNDDAIKTGEMKPDEVPTDDDATLDPASDAETGGWQIEVCGNKYEFSIGSTVKIGKDGESDIVLQGNDSLECRILVYCDTNVFSIANNGRMDVSVANTKVGVGQRVSVSCLFTPCVIRVGFNTQIRIVPITSWKITADGFDCRRVIGRGGQSVVFEAVRATSEDLTNNDSGIGDKVALKVLRGYRSDEDLQRLKSLIAKMSTCDTLNRRCLRVYNGVTPMTAMAMNLLDGESLYMRLRRHPHGLDVDEAVRIMWELMRRLSCLHEQGIIHRDIKPSNVFICRSGGVELLDFTLAKWNGDTIRPLDGKGIGTPQYRAPEMETSGFTGDAQSDIYSATLVFREMLCGRLADGKGYRTRTVWGERENHPHPTLEDRIASACKLAPDVDKILEKGLAPRDGRYSSCKEFLADLETVRFPVYEHDGHHYTRLTYEQCEGCAANGVAYGKVLDKEAGQVLKWKTFATMNLKNEWCYYSKGEVRVGLLSRIHDSSLNCGGIVAAFPIREGNSDLMMLVYAPGMDDPANTPRYQGKTLWGLTLRGRDHTNVMWTVKQIPVADVLFAFARYARALSILHGAGVKTLDLAPDILMYEDGKPNLAAITSRRYGCWCDGGAGAGPREVAWVRWCGVWKVWEECYRSFYRLPNGVVCDAFALGLCLYETITGQRGYSNPCRHDPYRGEQGNIIHKGPLSVDLDRPVLAKYADVADVIRRLTEVDERRRLKDMDKIEDLLRNLAVKYRLKGGEDAVNEPGPFAQTNFGETVNGERGCSKMTFSRFNAVGGWFGNDSKQPTGRGNSSSFFKNMLARFRNKLKRFKVKPISPSLDCKGTPFRHLIIPSIGNLDADQETPCSICDVRERPEPLS